MCSAPFALRNRDRKETATGINDNAAAEAACPWADASSAPPSSEEAASPRACGRPSAAAPCVSPSAAAPCAQPSPVAHDDGGDEDAKPCTRRRRAPRRPGGSLRESSCLSSLLFRKTRKILSYSASVTKGLNPTAQGLSPPAILVPIDAAMKYYHKTQFGRERTPGDPQRFHHVNSLVWRCGAAPRIEAPSGCFAGGYGVRALPVLTAHDISLPEQ